MKTQRKADDDVLGQCLTDGCKSQVCVRGLCSSCYQAALIAIHRKETTWDELEKLDLSAPARRVGWEGKFLKGLVARRELASANSK